MLRFAGLVGTGFDEAQRSRLLSLLQARRRSANPFVDDPGRGDAKFAHPELVVEVEFSNWTNDDIVRHAVYKGLRMDKNPREIVRET